MQNLAPSCRILATLAVAVAVLAASPGCDRHPATPAPGTTPPPISAEDRAEQAARPPPGEVASAPERPRTAAVDCRGMGSGITYEVGPNQHHEAGPTRNHEALSTVPWSKLGPGDTVRIHHRVEPYREKILLSTRGTAEQPIRVCGVPGPAGELPVIDGENAVTPPGTPFPHPSTEKRGVVVLSLARGDKWGHKPAHIRLEGLEIRNGYDEHGFVDSTGARQKYSTNAASVFIERGENVTLRGCTLRGSSNGLFVGSGDSEETLSRNIVVEGNHIHDNGAVGKRHDRSHNAYTEAIGMVFQDNRFGRLREGSGGNNLKDRSAGVVIRYNWIEGGAHNIDLVEPEDSRQIAGQDPRLREAFVYGNVLVNGERDGARIVHYGGDSGLHERYRKGTLFFYHNTVIIRASEEKHWYTSLLRLDTREETADVRNNIILVEGTTNFTVMVEEGRARLGTNWFGPKWKPGRNIFQGEVSELEGASILVGAAPGLVDVPAADLRPLPHSPVVDRAGALHPKVPTEHQVRRQYAVHQQSVPRAHARDLGAFARP